MVKRLIIILTAFFILSPASFCLEGKKVVLSYVEWAETVASTYVVKKILEEKGYSVEIISASAAAMWSGDVDGFTGAWLPVTHGEYIKKHKKDVEVLGKVIDGAKIGLAVPDYVDIDSIEDLKSLSKDFNGEIIGIDPGAGIMRLTEKAIKEYGLNDFEVLSSSGTIMTAILKDKIKNKEPVVVTAWSPHWMFSKWNLKYLKDPKKVFGEREYVASIARKGLKKEKPEVYRILKSFKWSLEDCKKVMLWAADSSPEKAAEKWVNENREKIEAMMR